jgi:phage terminase small subunit
VSEKKNQNMLLEPEQFAKRGLSRRKRLSPKQEKFVQLFVYHDLTKKECAIRAGYKSPSVSASTMLHGVQFRHVQDRIAELTESKQLKYGITFDKVSRDLQMIRDAALEDGAYGPAVQAEMGRAKLAGLMIDKKEIKTGTIDQMDRGEVEARLRNLIEKHELVRTETIEVQAEDIEEDDEVEGEVEEVDEVDEELDGEDEDELDEEEEEDD